MSEEHPPASPADIWNKVWSWAVVGSVLALLLGLWVSFMTSAHPWLGDVFLVTSAVLFLAKFLTWEEARQQTPSLRHRISLLAILITAMVSIASILGSHYLNRSKENTEPKGDAKPLQTQQLNENRNASEKIESAQASTDPELATVQLNCVGLR